MLLDGDSGQLAVEFVFEAERNAMFSSKLFDKPGANIMTRMGVFDAWIAKSNNELDGSQSLLLALFLGAAFGFWCFSAFFGRGNLFFTFNTWVVNANHNRVMVFVHFKNGFYAFRQFDL